MKKWDDVYRLPLRVDDGGWIYDDNDNFVAQFLTNFPTLSNLILDCINGKVEVPSTAQKVALEGGVIKTEEGLDLILIRGWGNLTGSGAMRLPPEEASNIQDTFAEFIISKLTPNADLS